MEEKQQALLLEKQYRIPFELFREAFIAFQKRFVYPRSYLTMGILAVICVIYGYFVVNGTDSGRPVYCMVIMFCLMLMAFQWYNPRKVRRTLMEGIKEIEDDEYRLRIYPEYLEIGTILPPEETEASETDDLFDDTPEEDFSGTRIYYNRGMHVIEYGNFFMLYQQKTMFYVIPKTAFSEEELEIMRVHFSQRIEKNFKSVLSK